MAENKSGGIGTVVFDASPYGSDGETNVVVEYSNDSGTTWNEVGTVTFSGTDITSLSVDVNQGGDGRIRFRQTSGKRWNIDNISISNYNEIQGVNELEYHSWDAFCRDGRLIVECREGAAPVSIYGVDGITWTANEQLAPGEHSFDLPRGLYIVVSNDFSRRVLVK